MDLSVPMTSIKLIDGNFTPEEAENVLLKLLDSKIKFHALENFSSQIRGNQDNQAGRQRVAELVEATESVRELVKQAKEQSLNFTIKSTIVIELH